MKNITIICLFLVTIMATKVIGGPLSPRTKDSEVDFRPNDFFEDLIGDTLGMSVKELLEAIQNTFGVVNTVTTEVVTKLNEIMRQATPEVIRELENIRDNVLKEMINIMAVFLGDLGNVIPKLTQLSSTTDKPGSGSDHVYSAADIIRAILGITLENFIIKIKEALQLAADLLTTTMQKFLELEEKGLRPEIIGQTLKEISEVHLMHGRSVVMPMLDNIAKLL